MKIHSLPDNHLSRLYNLALRVGPGEDLTGVLNQLCAHIRQIMRTDVCSLYLYDQESQLLTLAATFGLNQNMINKVQIKRGEGLTGTTIEKLQPISLADGFKNPDFKFIPGLGEEHFPSFLSIPLFYGKTPIGVMVVQNRRATKFRKEDIELLMTLTLPAVTLIEKAKFLGSLDNFSGHSENSEESASDTTLEYLRDHVIKGIPAAPGITMGHLRIVRQMLARRQIAPQEGGVEIEKKRLLTAFDKVQEEIRNTREKAAVRFGPEEASIFDAYLLFLDSEPFKNQILGEISRGAGAVKALESVVTKYLDRMTQADDEYLRERSYDIQDIARKITNQLLYGDTQVQDSRPMTDDTILLSEFWSISDFVNFHPHFVKGIISPQGGASSHIAILADALNLPAVLGLGSSINQLRDDDYLIMDGYAGTVIVNPKPETIKLYQEEIAELKKHNTLFEKTKTRHIKLDKGKKHWLKVGANLGMVAHVTKAIDCGADDVGLYRTEFPFLIRNSLPTEEEQYHLYSRVLELMHHREVTFRTLDIGGDKYISYLNLPKEANPAMGWRSIRFSLERRDLFRIQLRALLRASVHGKMNLLFPMISSVEEIHSIKEVLKEVEKELREERIRFAKNIPIGVMIEVPSAVEVIDHISKEVSFISIGTNDLMQYTLAVDRTNPLVAKYYDPYHPAIWRLIFRTISQAHKSKIKVSVCGSIASIPALVAILAGFGVDALSMNPGGIPRIKYFMGMLKLNEVKKLAQKILRLSTSKEIKQEIYKFLKKNNLLEFAPKEK